MSARTLEDLLSTAKNPVEYLRNSQAGPNVYPGVPAEFTNWRDEQQAWSKACVLFDQSYHMADLAVEGPGALALLERTGINSFKGFAVDKAKQFVPCTPEGYMIGDVILFYLAENKFNLVGRAPVLEWVTYQAEVGKFDVKCELDQRWALRTDGRRKSYRFQLQGPNAMALTAKLIGQTPPDLKFFNMTHLTIGGKRVNALRHGMSGQPGWELYGPWEDGPAVKEAIVKAGEEFGLRQSGGRAYSSNTLESGWIPSPLPAVYSGEGARAYRQWLKEDSYEAKASIGGSFVSDNIEDYYLSPWDLSYGAFVKFDHDFIGREALEAKAKSEPPRTKVTLALDDEDVMAAIAGMLRKEGRTKFMDWPSAVYSMHPFDKVLAGGKTAGVSTWIGYSSNEGKWLTLAVLDQDYAGPGQEVSLVWGEENGGTRKPTVERHVQTEIRAIVSPVPYAQVARTHYAEGWRTHAA